MYKYKKKYNWNRADYEEAIRILEDADFANSSLDDKGHSDLVALWADVWSYEQGKSSLNYTSPKPNRRLDLTIINNSFDAYESPATGKVISSHKQRKQDLAESGCMEYDPGVKQDATEHWKREEAKLEKNIENTVEREIESMSSSKREDLYNELKHSDLEYTRG